MAHVEVTSVRKPRTLGVVMAGVLALACALLMLARAQGAVQAAEAATVTVTPTTVLAELPDQLAPGYTTFALDGALDNGATLSVFRLKDGVAVEEFTPALEAVDRAFMGEGNPVEALNAALAMADVVADLSADPGQSQRVSLVLAEGEYLLDYAPYPLEETAPLSHTFQPFTVSGEVQTETPEADVEVEMVDFAFSLPAEIGAGEQLWRVWNRGDQLHHMQVLRLADGATVDDVLAWLETEEGVPPGEPAAYVGITSPGYSTDQVLDLAPGRYVAICFMPDHLGNATGMPHFMLGMVQEFEVAGE